LLIIEIRRGMKGLIFFLIASFFLNLNASAIVSSGVKLNDSINDGPHIFNVKGKLTSVTVKNGRLSQNKITPENFTVFKESYNFHFNYEDLTYNHLKNINYSQSYSKVDSIAVVSDIHGEYTTYLKLLKTIGIIDDKLQWKFGTGHLVILGDIFDRGEMVTELLWHLFGLEKQAAEAGGMVHILLGNHEIMVLSGTLRYINNKYRQVERITGISYSELYSQNSVLGNWIRSKPVVVTINDIIFVHGGISSELVRRNLAFRKVNELFAEKIVGKVVKEINPATVKPVTGDSVYDTSLTGVNSGIYLTALRENEELLVLVGDYGPVWYRGYFTDANFTEKDVDAILRYYKMSHIVVGHTTCADIDSQYSNKIIGVDAGLGSGQPGEMLIWKNGSFYSSYSTGNRMKL
jgi:hypothetical protein